MIRVIHYGMGPNLGGIETYLYRLEQLLRPLGVHSDFLYSDQGRPPVFAAELAATGSGCFGVIPRRESPLRNRLQLRALLTKERFDILHFHANTASYVAPIRAALSNGLPIVYHSHNAGTSRSQVTRGLHLWNRSRLPWDRLTRVAVSAEAGRWMFGQRSFETIANGVDAQTFAFNPDARGAQRRALRATPTTLLIGLVGALLPAKNHSFAVDILKVLVSQGRDARLILVGDGPAARDIRRHAAAGGFLERVHFLGVRTDVPALLSAFDILIMPSLHEGFGLAALEAQAAGLPCLTSTAVPAEISLSKDCRRLPLAAGEHAWAQSLLDLVGSATSRHPPSGLRGFTTQANAQAVGRIYGLLRTR